MPDQADIEWISEVFLYDQFVPGAVAFIQNMDTI
jgi:hypothetical protein